MGCYAIWIKVTRINSCKTRLRQNYTSLSVACLHWPYSQCCGSGMFIPDPGSWFLPIPDPGSKNSNKREGWKKFFCHTFLFSLKCHKIEHYFSFKIMKKKIWANFQRIIELFTQKIVTKLSKIWVRDPGSGIRDPGSEIRKKPNPDPGSRDQKGTGSRIQGSKRHRIPDPDPQHCLQLN